MKTDTQLHRDVADELAWEPSITSSEIGIAVKDGVVTLSGFANSYAEKFAAKRAVERVRGVQAVADDLLVKLPISFKKSDTDIAHACVTALQWDIQVPDDKIKSVVEDGWVTLDGGVEWQFQRQAAERAVRNLSGVKGVTNRISVKPKAASSFEVSQKIRDALRRSAEDDAAKITVEAKDGRVTLRGKVRSYAEREDAERAAWAAPGVFVVDDRLAIAL
jgi:osmotically-inducible protein OsmY